jgi:hypothetical protein
MPEPSFRSETLDGLSEEGCGDVEGAKDHSSRSQKSRGVGTDVAIGCCRAEASEDSCRFSERVGVGLDRQDAGLC